MDGLPILVVEDNDDLRQATASVFALEGFTVTEARNGREALESLRRERPVAILLDIAMPVMDGRIFLHELKKLPELAGIPVILTTAAFEFSREMMPPVFGGFFPKPYDMDRLVSTVRFWADKQRSEASAVLPGTM